jgi:hypothetical protein
MELHSWCHHFHEKSPSTKITAIMNKSILFDLVVILDGNCLTSSSTLQLIKAQTSPENYFLHRERYYMKSGKNTIAARRKPKIDFRVFDKKGVY